MRRNNANRSIVVVLVVVAAAVAACVLLVLSLAHISIPELVTDAASAVAGPTDPAEDYDPSDLGYYATQLEGDQLGLYVEMYENQLNKVDSDKTARKVTAEDFKVVFHALIADHPEFFWLDGAYSCGTNSSSGMVVEYTLSTTVAPEERDAVAAQIDAAAAEALTHVDTSASPYDQVKAVYDWIVTTTDYGMNSPNNQNIQSVFLDHVSVCSGYSRAFQYLMGRLGIPCIYVSGDVQSGPHAWNIVQIDGAFYQVDVTMGDPVFADDQVGEAGAHPASQLPYYSYLCCTDEELRVTHAADEVLPLPACTDESLNFYKRNGMYYETYDEQRVENALVDALNRGDACVVFKFSPEVYPAALDQMLSSSGVVARTLVDYLSSNGEVRQSLSYTCDEDHQIVAIWL